MKKNKSEWVNTHGKRVTGEDRHAQFQRPNPMEMSPFEKSLSALEKIEREEAKRTYIRGIQGVDGGRCQYRSYDEG
jgi:hypothetical protein